MKSRKKRPRWQHRAWWVLAALAVVGVTVAFAIPGKRSAKSQEPTTTQVGTTSTSTSASAIDKIANGYPLYSFLLKEIPQVVSKVPCACCGKALAWCYRGGCPPG